MKSIKKFICRIFGHILVTEVYAERCDNLWGFPKIQKKKAECL